MLSDRQFLLMRGAGDRTVDVGEPAVGGLVVLVPRPDLGRRVIGRVGHSRGSMGSTCARGPGARPVHLTQLTGRLAGRDATNGEMRQDLWPVMPELSYSS